MENIGRGGHVLDGLELSVIVLGLNKQAYCHPWIASYISKRMPGTFRYFLSTLVSISYIHVQHSSSKLRTFMKIDV